jgi:hypothetical protein
MSSNKTRHSGTRWLTALDIQVLDNRCIYENVTCSFCRLPVTSILIGLHPMVHGEPYLDRYFCPCYNGGSRGFKGVNFPEDLKKHIIKNRYRQRRIKLQCFPSLFFLSDFSCRHSNNLLAILPYQS